LETFKEIQLFRSLRLRYCDGPECLLRSHDLMVAFLNANGLQGDFFCAIPESPVRRRWPLGFKSKVSSACAHFVGISPRLPLLDHQQCHPYRVSNRVAQCPLHLTSTMDHRRRCADGSGGMATLGVRMAATVSFGGSCIAHVHHVVKQMPRQHGALVQGTRQSEYSTGHFSLRAIRL